MVCAIAPLFANRPPVRIRSSMTPIHVRAVSGESDWQAVKALRCAVFVEEQGLPAEEEFDSHDESATHAAAFDPAGRVVGAGRLYRDAAGEARIGRMAVRRDMRRSGIGGELLRWLEAKAVGQGAGVVVVHAQAYLERFYARRGYVVDSPPFIEDGLEHICMTKALPAATSTPQTASAVMRKE